ncbi:hypothetical protein [Symbioplanes lichenis]|uniref:hypothetical protein n=1 Tax=Symbioplanes lichenis TaxID=1629072 RepID=UPI00273A484F|nr:hypothetical protein [Actinoplanes lichenis]
MTVQTPARTPVKTHGKTIAAFAVTVATAVYPLLQQGRIGAAGAVSIAIAIVTNVGVYIVPLAPNAKWAKSAVAVGLSALNVAATLALDGGISMGDWGQIVIAAGGAAVVYLAPAATPETGTQVGWGKDS